jgi:peptide/nickel transport system substrate-binding protein
MTASAKRNSPVIRTASALNGIGPYKFVAYQPGEYFDLAAFPGYCGKQPAIRNVRFEFVGDADVRVAKLHTGEADMIMDTPFPQVDALRHDGFQVVKLRPIRRSASSSICSMRRHRGMTGAFASPSRMPSTATRS